MDIYDKLDIILEKYGYQMIASKRFQGPVIYRVRKGDVTHSIDFFSVENNSKLEIQLMGGEEGEEYDLYDTGILVITLEELEQLIKIFTNNYN